MTNSSNIAYLILKYCVGCGACVEICPIHAIPNSIIGFNSSLVKIDEKRCDGCGSCVQTCSHRAIKLHNNTDQRIS
ncbi:hypothetical protein LCGC14_1808090 [marine sediment metagenome]|uniref:4Fe-4S ferredoxin-type domain-containing protein n=1 Tax=marine sediment metagenome TaxID=412755 RepID=A0A0F9GMR9_9ZZZZ